MFFFCSCVFSDTPFAFLKNKMAPLHKFPICHSLQITGPKGENGGKTGRVGGDVVVLGGSHTH